MVGPGRAVAIDPEFASTGRSDSDLGALWANFVISSARARVLRRPAAFQADVDGFLASSWQAFSDELRLLWPTGADPFMRPRYTERYLRTVFSDALGFAGAKATRRMIGYAHVADIETLEDPERATASGAVLRVARRFDPRTDRLHHPARCLGRRRRGARGAGAGRPIRSRPPMSGASLGTVLQRNGWLRRLRAVARSVDQAGERGPSRRPADRLDLLEARRDRDAPGTF